MFWKDFNGNEHSVNDCIEIKLQFPNCKYLLPCGLCTLYPELKTCRMLLKVGDNNADH